MAPAAADPSSMLRLLIPTIVFPAFALLLVCLSL
jgi:hypothetical protein